MSLPNRPNWSYRSHWSHRPNPTGKRRHELRRAPCAQRLFLFTRGIVTGGAGGGGRAAGIAGRSALRPRRRVRRAAVLPGGARARRARYHRRRNHPGGRQRAAAPRRHAHRLPEPLPAHHHRETDRPPHPPRAVLCNNCYTKLQRGPAFPSGQANPSLWPRAVIRNNCYRKLHHAPVGGDATASVSPCVASNRRGRAKRGRGALPRANRFAAAFRESSVSRCDER